MQLNKKKELAARTLNIGINKIIFNKERLNEIKEAITKQDIRDLVEEKAITIREVRGRRKNTKRKSRRREGSIKKKVKSKKKEYVIITRKLRALLFKLKKGGVLNLEEYRRLRREIRMRKFRNESDIKEKINQLIKERK